MRLKPPLSKEEMKTGLTAGFTLAFVSLITAGIGAFLNGRLMEAENRAFVQQSVGESTAVRAKHFRIQIDHLLEQITELGKNQLYPRSLDVTPKSPRIDSIPMDSMVFDLSLWGKGEQKGAFDLYPEPRLLYFALNSLYTDTSPAQIHHLYTSIALDSNLLRSAFQGHTVINFAPASARETGMGLVVTPLGQGLPDQIIVALVRMERLQAIFNRDEMSTSVLADDFGNLLAYPDLPVQKKEEFLRSSLYQAMRTSRLEYEQLNFRDSTTGNAFFGGYSRVGVGHLAVLANISEGEALSGLKLIKEKMAFLMGMFFLFFWGIGFWLSTRIRIDLKPVSKSNITSSPFLNQLDPSILKPKKVTATIIHVSIRSTRSILESDDPVAATETLTDFFTLCESLITRYGGIYEKYSGTSLIGIWGAPNADGTEIWSSLRCALAVRTSLSKFNGQRKTEGTRPVAYGIGVHTGTGLAARLGAANQQSYTVTGEVVQCATALDHLSATHGLDLLVSQDTWQRSEAKFLGDLVGETKLTTETGLTEYYSLHGYRDEQGCEVKIEFSPGPSSSVQSVEGVLPFKKVTRWLVNNGSQIVGPISAQEIASGLYAQELDFDCQCWAEGTGSSAQIKDAGIFSGSEDAGSSLWLFDGTLVHGPMSPGFLKTALAHGAIKESTTFICEESTIKGWKPLSEYLPGLLAALSQPSESTVKNALHDSLAPPEKKAA